MQQSCPESPGGTTLDIASPPPSISSATRLSGRDNRRPHLPEKHAPRGTIRRPRALGCRARVLEQECGRSPVQGSSRSGASRQRTGMSPSECHTRHVYMCMPGNTTLYHSTRGRSQGLPSQSSCANFSIRTMFLFEIISPLAVRYTKSSVHPGKRACPH